MATLIVGSPANDCAQLRSLIFDASPEIANAAGCREALAAIQRTAIRLVICEQDLPDGSWRDILEAVSAAPTPPLLIVTSRLADERLWAEVLNLGGYDVLPQPFEGEEVRRVVVLARDQWLRTHGPATPLSRGAFAA